VYFLTTANHGGIEYPDWCTQVRYLRFPDHTIGRGLLCQALVSLLLPFLLLSIKPDVVVTEYSLVPVMIPFAILAKIELIRTCFHLDLRSEPVSVYGVRAKYHYLRYWLGMHLTRRFFRGVTVITDYMADKITKQFGFKREHIGVWESGVDVDLFNPDNCLSRATKTDVGLSAEFVAMHHGAFDLDRGILETIEAVVQLHQSGYSIGLFLLGAGMLYKQAQSLVKEREAENYIVVNPPVRYEKVPGYIVDICDIGLCVLSPEVPWWRGSSPMKIMEYLAMGKPVIVTDIEAHRAILSGQPFSIFISKGGQSDISNALKLAYERRVELSSLASEARSFVSLNYPWQAQALLFEAYLIKMLEYGDGEG
jgi:glycosyltransferase involved in cell wall biosynthesis